MPLAHENLEANLRHFGKTSLSSPRRRDPGQSLAYRFPPSRAWRFLEVPASMNKRPSQTGQWKRRRLLRPCYRSITTITRTPVLSFLLIPQRLESKVQGFGSCRSHCVVNYREEYSAFPWNIDTESRCSDGETPCLELADIVCSNATIVHQVAMTKKFASSN